MIRVDDLLYYYDLHNRLGGRFPVYMVTSSSEAVQAIFFSREYALLYARALSKAIGEPIQDPIQDTTTG